VTGQCPRGATTAEVAEALADAGLDVDPFYEWLRGKTVGMCGIWSYDHDRREQVPSECASTPHGIVVYRSDLQCYIDNRRQKNGNGSKDTRSNRA
jgi:hypothetical protein